MATPAFLDGLERALWTAAEAAGAVGLVAGYQTLDLPDIPPSYLPLAIVAVGGLLAGGKAWAAQRWGNGTAATLPASLEPVPATVVEADREQLLNRAETDRHNTWSTAWQDGYQAGRQTHDPGPEDRATPDPPTPPEPFDPTKMDLPQREIYRP